MDLNYYNFDWIVDVCIPQSLSAQEVSTWALGHTVVSYEGGGMGNHLYNVDTQVLMNRIWFSTPFMGSSSECDALLLSLTSIVGDENC